MDTVFLASPDGAKAKIHLHGAHLASWQPADGPEVLYMSPAAVFKPGVAIRGGVPVIFPQFGPGPLLRHGFARLMPWKLVSQTPSEAILELTDCAETYVHWPHAFRLQLQVRIGGNKLQLALEVENRDTQPFDFTASLHTYLAVSDVLTSEVRGLRGLDYTNSPEGTRHTETEETIRFGQEIDRAYHNTEQREVTLDALVLRQSGFQDTVVWNPGPSVAEGIKDLPQPNGWKKFVCVEATQYETPARLAPQQVWCGTSEVERR